MGLIADFENIVLGYKAESRPGGLEVIDSLSHVALSGENKCSESFVVVLDLTVSQSSRGSREEGAENRGRDLVIAHLFKRANLLESLEYLCIS